MEYKPDKNTDRIRAWLNRNKKNVKALSALLEAKGHSAGGVAHALSSHELKSLRKEIINEFKIN